METKESDKKKAALIIEKMQDAYKVRNDKALAKAMKLGNSSVIFGWRKRGNIPSKRIQQVIDDCNVNYEWLNEDAHMLELSLEYNKYDKATSNDEQNSDIKLHVILEEIAYLSDTENLFKSTLEIARKKGILKELMDNLTLWKTLAERIPE